MNSWHVRVANISVIQRIPFYEAQAQHFYTLPRQPATRLYASVSAGRALACSTFTLSLLGCGSSTWAMLSSGMSATPTGAVGVLGGAGAERRWSMYRSRHATNPMTTHAMTRPKDGPGWNLPKKTGRVTSLLMLVCHMPQTPRSTIPHTTTIHDDY